MKVRQYKDILLECLVTLRHARTFVTSREKMHQTGIELYDNLIVEVADALNAPEPCSEKETVPAPEQSIVKAFEQSPRRVQETSPAPADPDEETPCPEREDGMHCECWYGGNPCCGCGREDVLDGRAKPPCSGSGKRDE